MRICFPPAPDHLKQFPPPPNFYHLVWQVFILTSTFFTRALCLSPSLTFQFVVWGWSQAGIQAGWAGPEIPDVWQAPRWLQSDWSVAHTWSSEALMSTSSWQLKQNRQIDPGGCRNTLSGGSLRFWQSAAHRPFCWGMGLAEPVCSFAGCQAAGGPMLPASYLMLWEAI